MAKSKEKFKKGFSPIGSKGEKNRENGIKKV
jgi:hypothetical protein